jgi:hypothetical protein
MWAAVLVSGNGGCPAGLTGLEASGLRNWADPKVHVLIPRASGIAELTRVSRVVHETRRPPRDSRVSTGLPRCVTVERAAVDAAPGEAIGDPAAGCWLRSFSNGRRPPPA